MTLDTITPSELATLWLCIQAEPEYHVVDDTPNNFDSWLAALQADGIDVFAVRTGKKFVGAIGFQPSTGMLRGVHFLPGVRGSGLPLKALQALLLSLFAAGLETVTFRYLASNIRAHRFFRRSGAEFLGVDGATSQHGVSVPLFKAAFHASTFSQV